jgi:phage N-6-adenine-methyltransferase
MKLFDHRNVNPEVFDIAWRTAREKVKSSVNRSYYSKLTDEWETPPDLFRKLNREFHFTLDACASRGNHKCNRYYTKEDNGRRIHWINERVYMNPPYSEVGKWMHWAYYNCLRYNALVVCLVLARTSNFWFHEYAVKGEIRFIRGRLRFLDSDKEPSVAGCPVPSIIVVFRPGELKTEANGEYLWSIV